MFNAANRSTTADIAMATAMPSRVLPDSVGIILLTGNFVRVVIGREEKLLLADGA